MARVLWIGDAGTHTGFASVTHAIGERLMVDHGHDVRVLAANYQGDHYPTPLPLYPASMKVKEDIYGDSRLIEMLAMFSPEAVVFLNDPAIVVNTLLFNRWDTEQVLWRGFKTEIASYKPPILAYLPVDGRNSPRSWDVLSERVTRIAMTKFGRDTAMPEAPVIWHGVDTDLFHPRDKAEAKRELGFDPDRFLILRVDANSLRKDYAATWAALRPILRKYDDIDVFFHCLERPGVNGVNLMAYRFNDEDIRDRVAFPNIGGFLGWTQQQMALLYAAADLFVSTSHGEGFGLTLLEAIASGTPVLAQNCSCIPEVTGPGAVLVEPKGWIAVPMGQEQALPDIDRFTMAIDGLYHGKKWRRDLAKAGVEHAQQFSWKVAGDRFNTLIEREVAKAVPFGEAVEVS